MFTHASRRGFVASAILGLVSAPLAFGAVAAPAGAAEGDPVAVQILATNDFHGRIQNDTTSASAGAAVLAGAVKQLRTVNPNTVFAAAGDLIGASTFESFIAKDRPTIDALNEAGLEVSAVGNHEFDAGYNDLVNRVMAPYNAETNPYGGASWKYLGANVKFKADDTGALDGTWIKDMGGVQVGFIGAVTEHLPELVSPGGISTIKVTDIPTAANAAADHLKSAGADVIVLLVHEGAAGTDCATITSDTTSDFGKITSGVNDNIDAIVSGHTHLTYNCSQPVPGWSGRPITTRPIVSAGQYGMNLNQRIYVGDPTTGIITSKTQAVLPLKNGTTGSTFNYPVDSNTAAIVSSAVSNANVLGAQPLGQIDGAFYRAKLADGTAENRGGESALGNIVAEIQRWATSDPAFGSAQIAFMNPGGLRADLTGQGTGAFPRTVTFKDAANVQPFANTLVNEDLTGAQIKAALEQQWQPLGASRPFLKLGISKGFTYTYDPAAAQGSRIKAMFLNGTPIDLTQTYSVTVNAFLSTGGDNFAALSQGAGKQDTGRTDLQAQVDYFAANAPTGGTPLAVDYRQRGVGAVITTATPRAGQDVTVNLSSLSMTGPGDLGDTSVTASLNGTDLGSFPVTTTRQTALPGYDEAGTATVTVTLPLNASGAQVLVITGNNTATTARVPFTAQAPLSVATTVSGAADPIVHGTDGTVTVTVTPSTATGTVRLLDGDTLLGTGTLNGGAASITVGGTALSVGSHDLTLNYLGATGFDPSTGTVTVTVVRAPSAVTGTSDPITYGQPGAVAVSVTSSGGTPTGDVELRDGATVVGTVTLTDGAGTIMVPAKALTVGEHTLTLAYLGATSFEPDTGTVTVTVVRAPSAVTGTSDPITYGRAGAVAVSVTSPGGTPSGVVELRDGAAVVGSVTLADGAGTITVPADALALGRHTLTLAYLGAASFEPSTGTITVDVVPIGTTVSGAADPIVYGTDGTVTVRVAPSGATGTVELRNGETVLGTGTLVAGTARITVGGTALAVGPHGLALRYLGATGYAPSDGSLTVNVIKATPTVAVTAVPSRVEVKTSNEVSVRVSAAGFTPTGRVQIRSGGTVVGWGTLSAGRVSIDVGPYSDTGRVRLTAHYLGDATTNVGSDWVAVTVVRQTPSMKVRAPERVDKGSAPTVKVVLDGVGAKVTGKVTFSYDGKRIAKDVVNQTVTLKLARLADTTVVTVKYAGNATFAAVTKKAKIVVN
ncbi:MAG: yhcR [Nocardioides sp.]|uniref:Ig-like domain repeat protein n=1 Tax=Nocardioides sp. TaxID=35761 RepID=UPI0026136A9F|nr:Ig-like domain repeat protein [Nocardioides sp.]MCW2832783.1 yhcR [Nocardioides sp.]